MNYFKFIEYNILFYCVPKFVGVNKSIPNIADNSDYRRGSIKFNWREKTSNQQIIVLLTSVFPTIPTYRYPAKFNFYPIKTNYSVGVRVPARVKVKISFHSLLRLGFQLGLGFKSCSTPSDLSNDTPLDYIQQSLIFSSININ